MDSFFSPSRARAIVTFGWPFLCVALLGVVLALYKLREDALDDARRDVANLAIVVREQVDKSVQSVDLLVRDVQRTLSDLGADTPETFNSIAASETFRRILRDKRAMVSQVDVLGMIDADGILINTSRDNPKVGIDLSEREHVRHMSRNDDPNLFVGTPVKEKASDNWSVFFARQIKSESGQYLGIAVASVTLKYFEDLYGSIDLPRDEAFLLLRRDGTTLVRHPDVRRRSGERVPPESSWYRIVAAGGGSYESVGFFSGAPRIVAVQPLKAYPLVVNVSVPKAAVLATWKRQVLVRGGGGAVILAFAALLLVLARRLLRAVTASRAELEAQSQALMRLSVENEGSKADLSRQEAKLRSILETLDQGLLTVDAAGTVVHWNERARELLGLPQSLLEGRPTFLALLTHQWNAHRASLSEDTLAEFVRKRMVTDCHHMREMTRPDGRVIEVRNAPMPDGGFIRSYTDVTARARAEEQARFLARHDELTNLMNGAAFRARLLEAIETARRSRRAVALLSLDLHGLKQVNDARGQDNGDRVLTEVARRMTDSVRTIDAVARLGGDAFAVVLPVHDETAAEELARRLIESIGLPCELDDGPCRVDASIGIALFPQDAVTFDELVARADAALNAAGKGTYRTARSLKSEAAGLSLAHTA